jgi:uncharacterized protein
VAIIQGLARKNLIHPPKWLPDNVHYLTDMGSVAYGTATGDSDVDIYGFCIPPREDVFPHLRGEILGFGRQVNRFEQWQEHHVVTTLPAKAGSFSDNAWRRRLRSRPMAPSGV